MEKLLLAISALVHGAIGRKPIRRPIETPPSGLEIFRPSLAVVWLNKSMLFFPLLLLAACGDDAPIPCEGIAPPVLGTCVAVAPHGGLSYDSSTDVYTYKTKGGGTVIYSVGNIQIRHDDYPNFKYELWGGYRYSEDVTTKFSHIHENLNGKHIKDKIGSNRTIVFPDGAKVTLAALNDTIQVLAVSIYEGADSYRINPTCNRTLEHSMKNECISQALDNAEADGEASSFEITSTGLMFFNLYREDSPGNKVEDRYNLGELFLSNPNRIDDYYDDPRLGHT